jgi:radical SAM protein with 4Fe4S-binding SPASM domain
VQLSLDGATAEVHDAVRGSGAFERTWAGIARLQRYGLHEELALNVTLMRHNVHQVAEFVALADERGVPGVRFCPVQCMGRAAEQWEALIPTPEEYAEAYRFLYHQQPSGNVTVSQGLPGMELEPPEGRMWCGLGRLLLVDSQGDIYPCSLLTTAEFRLGNVAQMTLAEALAAEPLKALVTLCEGRKDRIEECAVCTWRNFCQGSCPGAIWLEHGDWHAVDSFCDLRCELFPDLIFRRTALEGSSYGET